MKLPSSRLTYFIGFILIGLFFGIGFILQKYFNLHPCLLCILQRITLATLGVVFFFGMALNLPKIGRIFISILAILIAGIGTLLAARQVWLQHFPPAQNFDCGASLQYMLHVLPLTEILKKILTDTTECSQVDWQLFHLSLAEWSLIWFILFLLISIGQLTRIRMRQ